MPGEEGTLEDGEVGVMGETGDGTGGAETGFGSRESRDGESCLGPVEMKQLG